MFTFTEDGQVKFWELGDERGLILAETRDLADEFARWLRDERGTTVDVAEIGGEGSSTLDAQLNESMKHGANRAFVVRAVKGKEVEFDTLEPPH